MATSEAEVAARGIGEGFGISSTPRTTRQAAFTVVTFSVMMPGEDVQSDEDLRRIP